MRAARPSTGGGARAALAPLDSVERLKGIGPTARALLADESGIRTVADLVWTLPTGWDDLRTPLSVAHAIDAARTDPRRVAIQAVVASASILPMRGRRCVRVVLRDHDDDKCTLHALWFFLAHGALALAKPGASVLLVGQLAIPPKKPPRMAHPDLWADTTEARVARPRYPALGPGRAILKNAIAHAVAGLTESPDPVPRHIALREGMPEASTLLGAIHAVGGALPSEEHQRAFLERLAWGEAFTRAWERSRIDDGAQPRALALPPAPDAIGRLEAALGFALTADQRAACKDVASDLARQEPMRRLLLGDVGTGKTAVALAAVVQCVTAGRQAAILAPTSLLAEQYVAALRPVEAVTGARVALVVAGMGASERRASEAALAAGHAAIAIGTHALFSADVVLPSLSLVVVDEQQRLGVAQRLALVKKGTRPHLLTLSATPIPRTLALAVRGELATSLLRERPPGRLPVSTTLTPRGDVDQVIVRVRAAIERGERVYWIVARVEDIGAVPPREPEGESATPDGLASAEARVASLRAKLGATAAAALHGRMTATQKRDAMNAFRSGEVPILVGTTVVEVGVDVPEATLVVIEDPDRFGLAQLHQLRGRVGRGDRASACVLLHADDLDDATKARLEALTRLSTGEEIAHADLAARGAGDLSGTRQHGASGGLVFLDAASSYPWLERIDDDARAIYADDPTLERSENGVLGSTVARLLRVLAVREDAG